MEEWNAGKENFQTQQDREFYLWEFYVKTSK